MLSADRPPALNKFGGAMSAGESTAAEAMTSSKELSGSVLRAWLASSAPRTTDGAYCGWLDATTQAPSFAYPEIVGYMLTFAAYCGWTEEDAPGIDDAAQWLASGVSGDGLDCRPDKPDRHMYLFDLGMIAQGLLRYGVHTADARLVETGLAVVRTIRSALPPDVEVLRPVLGRHDLAPTWSTAGVAHLLKLLLSLLTAAELGDHASVAAADRLVASLGTPFQPGRTPPIVTCPGAEAISLHAACYAAEGLWAYGTARHHAGSSQQAHEIARWIWTRQLPDGGFPGFVDTGGRPMGGSQSDVLAQAVRLAYLTRADVAGIDRAVQALTASSARHGELAAMVYSPSSGKVHLNTWATTFAAQALDLHDSPDQLFDWRHLV